MASNDSERPLPLVGVSTYLEQARWGVWDQPAALLGRNYLDAITTAGGVPLMLPSTPAQVPGAAERVVASLDALVLAGGPDIDPARYGAPPHPRTSPPRPERDTWELRLLHAALAADLPVLAICRGAQLMTVAYGGTLHQHVPDVVGHAGHQPEPGVFGPVTVRLDPDRPPGTLLGPSVQVPCYHHQAIDELPAELEAVGWSPDTLVEAVLVRGHRFALGVQWHPEQDPAHAPLFTALVKAAVAPARSERSS